MRTLVQFFVRGSVILFFLYLMFADGFSAQIIGWGLTAWVLWCAAPTMWSHLKIVWSFGKSLSDNTISFKGRFKLKEDIGL